MSGLLNKTARIAARGMYRSALPKLKESMVSFAFDDCPASAITTAVPMLEAAGWRATILWPAAYATQQTTLDGT